jgi:hypothetical protein
MLKVYGSQYFTVSLIKSRYPSISAKAAMMMVAGFFIFTPPIKSGFFGVYYRYITLADGMRCIFFISIFCFFFRKETSVFYSLAVKLLLRKENAFYGRRCLSIESERRKCYEEQ